jgi:hypothetical protein
MQAMADDTQQDAEAPSDSGRPRRAPPTIDLAASDVTTAPHPEAPEAAAEPAGDKEPQAAPTAEPRADPAPASEPSHSSASISSASISPWVIAPFSGAVAAALVITIGWMLGWPQVETTPAPPPVSASTFDALTSRVAAIEAKMNKPAADPALAAHIDALGRSLASLGSDVAGLRRHQDELATTVDELKSAPHDGPGAVDLSGIEDRIVKLEQTSRTQTAAIAQESEKISQAKAANDLPLRRVIAATLLDVAVRHGDPYTSALEAAKAAAQNPDELKALDQFAATGAPNLPQLSRELLTLIPKLSPAPQDAPRSGAGILDRLQAGAEKLVRIERTDAGGNDRGAIVARATSAALHNDVAEARRELSALSPSDRAPVQGWLDKVAARDAALSASRQFANSAMADLAKTGQ